MDDLISRGALFEQLREENIPFDAKINEIINIQPVAYDVDVVTGELDEYLIKIVGRNSLLYKTIMEIVRKGGVE